MTVHTSDPGCELMMDLQQGNSDAFRRIVEMYSEDLVNFVYYLCGDLNTAQDIVQDALIRIYKSRDNYRATGKFKTFLYTVTKNIWIDFVRRKYNSEVSLDDAKEEVSLKEFIDSGSSSPVEILSEREFREKLNTCINRLPEKHRIVVVMGFIEGMKYSEISEALGIPEGTVKSRIFNALNMLKEFLGDSEK